MAGIGPWLYNVRRHGCGAEKSVQDFEIWCSGPGVRRIMFHDLRHTCASLLLAQGVSPRVLMDVLDHSQLSITMDLYSHVMSSALRDAADAMDRALSGGR
jgi:integrase